jgi:hypothetical protein
MRIEGRVGGQPAKGTYKRPCYHGGDIFGLHIYTDERYGVSTKEIQGIREEVKELCRSALKSHPKAAFRAYPKSMDKLTVSQQKRFSKRSGSPYYYKSSSHNKEEKKRQLNRDIEDSRRFE